MEMLAAIIFVLMYVLIVSEKVHRTIVAMMGAILMIIVGIMPVDTALHHIDFNTLGLLIGMMILVSITAKTGLFDYVAIKTAKAAKAQPRRLLIYLGFITALFSAFLDNVTTVLLMVPVTFAITTKLHIPVVPFLLTQILASNVGGTATLIGDPPNIMIGSAVKELTFVAFIENLTPVVILCMAAVLFVMDVLYRKQMVTKPELQAEIMQMDGQESLKDCKLLARSHFRARPDDPRLLHAFVHAISSRPSSLFGAFLLLLSRAAVSTCGPMRKVEWATIFFFIGTLRAVGGFSVRRASSATSRRGGRGAHGGRCDEDTSLLVLLALGARLFGPRQHPIRRDDGPVDPEHVGAMGVDNLRRSGGASRSAPASAATARSSAHQRAIIVTPAWRRTAASRSRS